MAEDDQDPDKYKDEGEEYQFPEFDNIEHSPNEESPAHTSGVQMAGANVKRNAIIAIVIIVCIMLGYKFIGPLFVKKTAVDKMVPPPPGIPVTTTAITPHAPPVQQVTTPPPPPPETPKPESVAGNDVIMQRLSTLEVNQQNLGTEIEGINNKLATLATSLDQLTTRLEQLNKNFTDLLARVEQQAEKITILSVRTTPKIVRPLVVRKITPKPVYFIQAIIPGRAWIINQNGVAITVREGTAVPGFGVVRMIDSRQGKVIMSSGKVIRFSQQDS